MKRYAIWNKEDPIITPIGEYLTAEEWMERHPAARKEGITVLCGVGEINGSCFEILNQVVREYESFGCDFSACTTDEEKLAVIEAFDDEMSAKAQAEAEERKAQEEMQMASLASIAASMEFQNLLTLEDAEV